MRAKPWRLHDACRPPVHLVLAAALLTFAAVSFTIPTDAIADTRDAAPMPVRALVIARQKATLSAEISGRITALPVRPGHAFGKDDRLVRFACDRYQAQRDTGAADVEAARKSLASVEKLVSLKSAGALDAEIAAAQLARAKAQLRLFQADVNRCSIRAPFSGRVVRWHANPFEVVSPGGKILDIQADRDLELEMIVPSRWLAWIRPGLTVAFVVDETAARFQPVVSVTDAEVDPVSQTVKVRARFAAPPEGLIPGMSGVASFPNAKPN